MEEKQAKNELKKLEKDIKGSAHDLTMAMGIKSYGERFEGKYSKIADIADLLPAFKELYYDHKLKDGNYPLYKILREFNETICYPNDQTFFPYPNQLRTWRRKWDADIIQKLHNESLVISESKDVAQIVKTRQDNQQILGLTSDQEIEMGTRTLAGELLNDSLQMLKDDQDMEEIYSQDVLLKRRNYVLNVFGFVSKFSVQKATLMLKASEEKRNNASFLMDLLASAAAGKITPEQLDVLKGSMKKAETITEQK